MIIFRFTIVHDNHHTWSLHIKDVQAEDRGYYMCQVYVHVQCTSICKVVISFLMSDHNS